MSRPFPRFPAIAPLRGSFLLPAGRRAAAEGQKGEGAEGGENGSFGLQAEALSAIMPGRAHEKEGVLVTRKEKTPEKSLRAVPLILAVPALLLAAAAAVWGVPVAADWLLAGLKAVVIP